MVSSVNYSLTRGLSFERLIVVKNKVNRRRVKLSEPSAYIEITSNYKKEITTEVTPEGAISLSLSTDETNDLPAGTYDYDVWANVYTNNTSYEYKPVARGTIKVTTYSNVTPLEDSDSMEIRYKQRTDYRRTFTWKDADGVLIAVTDAFMQAKNSAGTTVIDLRWYNPAPNESTVIALTPASKRGYLAPASGGTLEMHISDKNDVAAGSYTFDLFVKDSSGDWDCLAQGALIVEASISAPPV
jgi:hypothetical protein